MMSNGAEKKQPPTGYIVFSVKDLLETHGGYFQIKFKDDDIRHQFYERFRSGLHDVYHAMDDKAVEIITFD